MTSLGPTSSIVARFLSDSFDTAKAGRALEVYQAAKEYYDRGLVPRSSHYVLGWIIYYAMHQIPPHNILSRKKMLAHYLQLNVPKPHKLHSMILLEALRLSGNARSLCYKAQKRPGVGFSLVRFAELWDLSNLRPGDWRRKEYGGKLQDSTVERFIAHYVAELEETRSLPSDGFMDVIYKAHSMNPLSIAMLRRLSTVYILQGDNASARKLLRFAVLLAPREYELWRKIALTVDPAEEPECCLALLHRALVSSSRPEDAGAARLALARFWIDKHNPDFALWELNKYLSMQSGRKKVVTGSYQSLIGHIPPGATAQDPGEAYAGLEPLSDREAYSCIREVSLTLTYIQPACELRRGMLPAVWRLTDSDGEDYWIRPRSFSLPSDMEEGTGIMARIVNGNVVTARISG